jgi:hypothetical protein
MRFELYFRYIPDYRKFNDSTEHLDKNTLKEAAFSPIPFFSKLRSTIVELSYCLIIIYVYLNGREKCEKALSSDFVPTFFVTSSNSYLNSG